MVILTLAGLADGAITQQPASHPSPAPASGAPLAFTGMTAVDVEAGRLIADQTVVVEGNRIRAMGGDIRPPKGARVVSAKGKYLIPGLWDMHVHVRSSPERIYSLLIANGITGVRQMSDMGPPEWRRGIAAGERVGPRIVASIDIEARTADQSIQNIDRALADGADFVKVHNVDAMPAATYFAIAAYARKIGAQLVGHLPNAITEIQASDSGQRTVEHFNEVHCWWPDGERGMGRSRAPSGYPPPDSAGTARCADVARAFARNGTWFVPTLSITEVGTPGTPRHQEYWPKSMRAQLSSVLEKGCCPADPTIERARQVMPILHRYGIPILAGTDANLSIFPVMHGFGLHHELELLVEGGLSPLEALRTATLNPARYLHATDSLGTVAKGKLADLVLLDANPLEDITNTQTIRGVVANGRYFDREALDAMLAEIRKTMEAS